MQALGQPALNGEAKISASHGDRLAAKGGAERGELRTPLPVGYVHDVAGEVVIDPDAEVQAAVGDLFAAFAACGSAYGVVAAFTGRRFPAARLRRRLGRAAALGQAHSRPRAGCAEELRPKPAKTRIVQLTAGAEGVDFLGFHHRLVRSRAGPGRAGAIFLARWPSRKAMSTPKTASGS